MKNLIVPTDDNLFSTLSIGSKEFPFQLFHDNLDNFDKGFVNWHKQTQIEISYVEKGSVKVCLLKEEHIVTSDNAFIILPGKLHSIQPVDHKAAEYFTLIFDPCVLTGFTGSFFEKKFYSPIINSSNGYAQILHIPKFNSIFDNLLWIRCNYDAGNNDYLIIQRKLQDIWITLFSSLFENSPNAMPDAQDKRILQMITYLRTNYAEKFSLSDMADTLHVSRGECCRFFKKMMGMTISDYLLEYRIGKAAELLDASNISITEIAHNVGFHSASDFSVKFKKKTGYTPSEFRAK